MMHFMDESFWIAVCFVLFIVLTYRPIKKAIVNSLDSRINEIKQTMEQTQKLRDDARIILEQIELEMKSFESREKSILESAESSTARMVENKTKEIDMQINRMRDSATKSITTLKSKASRELQEEFTQHVMTLVRTYLAESNNNSTGTEEIVNNLLGKQAIANSTK